MYAGLDEISKKQNKNKYGSVLKLSLNTNLYQGLEATLYFPLIP